MSILTRTGEELHIFLKNKKKQKELNQETFNLLSKDLGKNLLEAVRFALTKDISILYYMLKTKFYYLFKNENKKLINSENILFSKIMGFDPKIIEISLGKKNIILESPANLRLVFVELKEIITDNQYNINKENIKGKLVADVGANIGLFSLYAACLGSKKIYAFEPVKGTFAELKKNISSNSFSNKIVAVNKAVGNKKGSVSIYFNYDVDGRSSLDFLNDKSRSQKVQVILLDDFFKNKVDFIKIDTEGHEEQVLLGAKRIIKTFKPILSFSAYHKKDDKTRLPSVLRNIRKDYKIELFSFCEDDFYCY